MSHAIGQTTRAAAHVPQAGHLAWFPRRTAMLLAVVAGTTVLVLQAGGGGSPSGPSAATQDAPDVVVTGLPGVDLAPLTELPGLAAASGPYAEVGSSVRKNGREMAVRLEARPTRRSAVGTPPLVAGVWPGRQADAIVVDTQLASGLRVWTGDRVLLTGVDGRLPVRISAVAAAPAAGGRAGSGGSLAYLSPALLARVAPNRGTHGSTLNLRLDDPARAHEFRRWIERRFPAGQVTVATPASS